MSPESAGGRIRRTNRNRSLGLRPVTIPVPANRLLDQLSPSTLGRLTPHLEPVALERKEVLFRCNEPLRMAYFPNTAIVSLVARLESGETLEVGVVGRDGLAGTSAFPGVTAMPCDGIVQVAGTAQRISADILRQEVMADSVLCAALSRYAQVLLVRSMQMAACNMFHSVEQRCIRWLLTLSDMTGSDEIPLTHELVATVLGTHRPTVTVTMRALQRVGLIDEMRGRLVLKDRARLQHACCECYRWMRDAQQRLLGY